jgi:3-hydroxyacyl-[acyl-carrier-protein] dehydratase
VTGAEDFLRGHFPGDPIVPGVLIGEALAQLSGLIGAKWPAMSGRLAHIDLRFLATARPPAEFQLSSRLLRVLGNVGLYDVTAAVGATTVARGSLSIARMVEP